ncbi:zinc-dependent alcohol dehydrogenase [Mycobacterium sp. IDR2000157661]|uniref:zinc-dependent alcohol dehydrogenase n=1 Tax=Mycobacterium sp. IDR2000157661 TaxID=2867005 RepID=UPI001EEB750F|nr:zinc-binding dehydrogenase [Mycobacterium sp. IDR2000157661]ULE32165.1 zinc-binding dehydrogenase [Mycobacterium sp. IDR2000157661]
MNADALVLTKPRTLELRTLPVPRVDDESGLLRIEACGLCGTDHEQFSGHLPAGFAFIPGHEIVGVIEEVGDAARARWGVSVGQRVAVEVFRSCRECHECDRGEYRRCSRNGLATMFGFVDVNIAPGLWGGYATHLHLPFDSMLLSVPDGLDPILATLFNPLGAGIKWAAMLPETGPGDVVAVLGPGIRGICAAIAAKEAGAAFVAMTGLGPRDRPRLAAAHKFGVDLTIDVTRDNPVRALQQATGRLADVVVDVTAKAPAAFAEAVALAQPGGRVVVAGTRGGGGAPGFEPDLLVFKELRVFGSLGVDYPAYQSAIELLVSGRWPFGELSRETTGFAGLPQLLDVLAGTEPGRNPALHSVFVPSA